MFLFYILYIIFLKSHTVIIKVLWIIASPNISRIIIMQLSCDIRLGNCVMAPKFAASRYDKTQAALEA